MLLLRILASVLPGTTSRVVDRNSCTLLLARLLKIVGSRVLMTVKDLSIENDGKVQLQCYIC